jgi:hypothetical protein
VVFVVGDFFWRLPLLLGSFFIVASSFLWVLGLLMCVGCILVWLAMVFLWFTGVRGALMIWSWSLMGRSLLIRDRESVLWPKFGVLFLEFFRWIRVSSDDGWFQFQWSFSWRSLF